MRRYNSAMAKEVQGFCTMIRDDVKGIWCDAADVDALLVNLLALAGDPDADKALAQIVVECRQAMKREST